MFEFFKEYRIELAAASAICCLYNVTHDNLLLAIVCGVAAVGNYLLHQEGK